MSNNNNKVLSKSSSRKLSFRSKESVNISDSTNTNSGSLSGSFNSVRGSIRRIRRVSGATTSSNPNSNYPAQQEVVPAVNMQPSAFPFSRIQSTIAGIAREQTSRLKEISISQKTADLTAVVQEMSTELGKKGAELGNMAMDRWKKRKEDNPPNGHLSHSENSKNAVDINILGAPLRTAVILTRVEKDVKQIRKDPFRYWLPAIVVRCMEFLDKYGLEEVGIYRIPGSRTTVIRIRDIFNAGADLNFLQSSKEDPHAVAALLKSYFRERSNLFKTFIENIDVVFGDGCKNESTLLENEKREQEVKEKRTPQIYHKTYISEDFSKSFEDILTLNKKTTANPSSHSYPSSSSIKGYNFKDNTDASIDDQDSTLRKYVSNNTAATPATSMVSNKTPVSIHKSTYLQQANNSTMNNPFSDDESISTLKNEIRSVNIVTPKSASSPPFRLRSRSTGLRDIPLTNTIEFPFDSSDSEDKDNLENHEDDSTSPTLMAFDYVDRHGAKNLGVLNLTTRIPNNWGSHGNGVGDNGNSVAPSWVRRRRRRPGLEKTEEWKKALLEDTDVDTPPNVPEENEMNRENDMKGISNAKAIINRMNGIGDPSHAREKTKSCVPVGNLIDL
ncbi:4346_t:CDS:2 [Acaulospora colombiana]|uniref:4346_t:CDS:1 n=1 Tax=Acaulospora colombiana TaxID=27376 RepID=A0ACA9L2Z5_9GLOM|nr:4346_t:CDS:2 [Acaulospora colombiana]